MRGERRRAGDHGDGRLHARVPPPGHGRLTHIYIVLQIALVHGAVCRVHSDDTATEFEIVWPRGPVANETHPAQERQPSR